MCFAQPSVFCGPSILSALLAIRQYSAGLILANGVLNCRKCWLCLKATYFGEHLISAAESMTAMTDGLSDDID